ncbi:MAG: hypothetical protein QF880_05530 [Candidatus Poseidonia sp.]|nr:hypothetical protein [Poseidonia sp.]
MYTMDDLKTNRDAQITVGSIVFFLLAFPIYFGMAAGNADGSLGGGVADYQVNGEITYVQLDSGTEPIGDGDPWTDSFNTDAINNAEDLNIVGLRLSMSYGEDETGGEGPLCPGGSAAPDTIIGGASHLDFSASAEGQNNGGSGAHEVSAIWYNASMVGQVVSGLSMDEIKAQIDSMGAGLGDHTVSISVASQAGNEPSPTCSRSDGGETVDYTVELMVLDYTIAPYLDTSDI